MGWLYLVCEWISSSKVSLLRLLHRPCCQYFIEGLYFNVIPFEQMPNRKVLSEASRSSLDDGKLMCLACEATFVYFLSRGFGSVLEKGRTDALEM